MFEMVFLIMIQEMLQDIVLVICIYVDIIGFSVFFGVVSEDLCVDYINSVFGIGL